MAGLVLGLSTCREPGHAHALDIFLLLIQNARVRGRQMRILYFFLVVAQEKKVLSKAHFEQCNMYSTSPSRPRHPSSPFRLFRISPDPPSPPRRDMYDQNYRRIHPMCSCYSFYLPPSSLKAHIFRNYLKKSSSNPRVASPKEEALAIIRSRRPRVS